MKKLDISKLTNKELDIYNAGIQYQYKRMIKLYGKPATKEVVVHEIEYVNKRFCSRIIQCNQCSNKYMINLIKKNYICNPCIINKN